MFRRLLRHLDEEFYRILKAIVNLLTLAVSLRTTRFNIQKFYMELT
jgi:hypothetical protein